MSVTPDWSTCGNGCAEPARGRRQDCRRHPKAHEHRNRTSATHRYPLGTLSHEDCSARAGSASTSRTEWRVQPAVETSAEPAICAWSVTSAISPDMCAASRGSDRHSGATLCAAAANADRQIWAGTLKASLEFESDRIAQRLGRAREFPFSSVDVLCERDSPRMLVRARAAAWARLRTSSLEKRLLQVGS